MGNVTSSTNGRYTINLVNKFTDGSAAVIAEMDAALDKLALDPSNPELAAQFQARLQEVTMFNAARTNMMKASKDMTAGIIQNIR